MTAVAPIDKFYWQQKINSKLEMPSTGTRNYESRRTPSLPVSRYGAVWVCRLNLKQCLKSSIRARSVVKAMFGKSSEYLCARVRSPEVIRRMMTGTAHSSVSLSHISSLSIVVKACSLRTSTAFPAEVVHIASSQWGAGGMSKTQTTWPLCTC